MMFARQCRLSVLKLASSAVYGSSCTDLALCVGGGINTHFLDHKLTPTVSALTRLHLQVPAFTAWHASVAVQQHLAPLATLTSPTSSANSAVYGRLDKCMSYILGQAAQASSSVVPQPVMLAPEVEAALRRSCHPDDHWLLVECGCWTSHGKGWTGPALALFQVWKMTYTTCDYVVWELGPDMLPTGKTFESGSEFEHMTSKHTAKKFATSCRAVSAPLDGRHGTISLKTFLQRTYGRGTGFKPKSLKTGEYAVMPAMVAVSQVLQLGPTAAAASDVMDKPHSMAWRAASAYPPGSPRPSRSGSSGSTHHRIYTGRGVLPPGKVQSIALEAAASAAAGPAPVYIWPTQVPAVLTQERMYDRNKPQPASRTPAWVARRSNLLGDIATGKYNMYETHVRLQELYPELAPSVDSSSSRYTNKWAAAEQLQVYDMTWLERPAGADVASGAAPAGLSAQELAVVPDATKPFTITQYNPADGQDYIVAHYEPHALAARSSRNAALLCAMFHSSSKKMTRQSAGEKDEGMVMAGMRIPRSGANHYARYAGDEGPEADQFALSTWGPLSAVEGFRAINEKWIDTLPGLVRTMSADAAPHPEVFPEGRVDGAGPSANYPAPTLLGSPFTNLGVTQSYFSLLHCEPEEHPFNYITWLDVLSGGSEMEVGYFWLTPGLAFLPQNGSALYIDVRLVTHCSDPCTVRYGKTHLEGRYGAAMFIQPNVMAANTELWAELSNFLHYRREDAKASSAGQRLPISWSSAETSGNAVSNNNRVTQRALPTVTRAPAGLQPVSPWQAPSLPQAEESTTEPAV